MINLWTVITGWWHRRRATDVPESNYLYSFYVDDDNSSMFRRYDDSVDSWSVAAPVGIDVVENGPPIHISSDGCIWAVFEPGADYQDQIDEVIHYKPTDDGSPWGS